MPTAIHSLAGKCVVDAACGYSHSACVTAIGQVYMWGSNKYHQLGLGKISRDIVPDSVLLVKGEGENDSVFVPARVPGLVGFKVVAVSCGKTIDRNCQVIFINNSMQWSEWL